MAADEQPVLPAHRERLRRNAAKQHSQERALGMFASRVANARQPAVVGALLLRVLSQFDSVDQYMTAAVRHFQTLRECHPTSRTLGNYYVAFMHLWRHYDECRPTNDFNDMDDEELEEFVFRKLLKRLQADPAIAALQSRKWRPQLFRAPESPPSSCGKPGNSGPSTQERANIGFPPPQPRPADWGPQSIEPVAEQPNLQEPATSARLDEQADFGADRAGFPD